MIFSHLKSESVAELDFSHLVGHKSSRLVLLKKPVAERDHVCCIPDPDLCIFMAVLPLTVESNLLFKTHEMTVVRKELWGLCNPSCCSKQYQLELVAEGLVQSGSEYLRGCRPHKLSRQFLCLTPIMAKNPNISVCVHCLFFSQLSPVRTAWLHLLYCPLPDIFKYALVSRGWTGHSLFLCQGLQSLNHLCGFFWTCTRISMALLCWGAQDLTQCSRCGPPISHRGKITSFDLICGFRKP